MSRRRLSIVKRAAAMVSLAVATVAAFAADSASQTAERRIATKLRRVTVSPDGVSVVIEASGALAAPSSGFADSPPRIYIDFGDVLPGEPIQPVPENPLVRRVRVAEHNPNPLVTRVVIDLTRPTAYRIDSSKLEQGRVVISLGASESATAARPQALPTTSPAQPPPLTGRDTGPVVRDPIRGSDGPAPARGTAPATPQTAAPAASGQVALEKGYDVRVSAALVRLHALRPLLESIDRQAEPLTGNLDAAVSEFEAIGKVLSAIKAPRSREGTHALLQRTCTMGTRAVRTRQGGAQANDPTAILNAASAAAGALLMLDRANKELAEGK